MKIKRFDEINEMEIKCDFSRKKILLASYSLILLAKFLNFLFKNDDFKIELDNLYDVIHKRGVRLIRFFRKKDINRKIDNIIEQIDVENNTKFIINKYKEKYDSDLNDDINYLIRNMEKGFNNYPININLTEIIEKMNEIKYLLNRKYNEMDPYGEEEWGDI